VPGPIPIPGKVNVMDLKTRLIVIMLLAGMCVPMRSVAVDDDYYIPYTDNYGYEYDPETGTYIKKDTPARVETGSTQTSPSTANTDRMTRQPVQAETRGRSEPEDSGSPAIPLVAGIVVVLGILLALSRKLTIAG
jgi:hypothetical protein